VFDSSGLKVYGEGEWKVRQHGADKRRTWRKFHIALDPDSQEIVLSELTPASTADAADKSSFFSIEGASESSRVFVFDTER
jgi:hypothetical protein